MKVGIICASDDELAPFLPLIKECEKTEKAKLRFYEGKICGVQTVAVFSGVCKVNAAIAAQILIDEFGVKVIVNSGTAGGIDPELKIFDTVISTEVCYHDVAKDILTEFHPWMDTVYFQADNRLVELSKAAVQENGIMGRVFWGRMVTGESFITNEKRQKLIDEFSALTADMETAGIAHVCYVNSIPFISIRCVTDTFEHSGTECFEKNCIKASGIAEIITTSLISKIEEM